jgi:hypothetical protein
VGPQRYPEFRGESLILAVNERRGSVPKLLRRRWGSTREEADEGDDGSNAQKSEKGCTILPVLEVKKKIAVRATLRVLPGPCGGRYDCRNDTFGTLWGLQPRSLQGGPQGTEQWKTRSV